MVLRLALLCCTFAVFCAGAEPAQDFEKVFAAPDGGPASLSTDGRLLATVVREQGELAVCITDTGSAKLTMRAVVGKDDARWVGGTRLVEPATVAFLRWTGPTRLVALVGGNVLLGIDHATKQVRQLIGFPGEEEVLGGEFGFLAGRSAVVGRRMVSVLAMPPGEPETVYVGAAKTLAGTNGRQEHRVFRVNAATGEATQVLVQETAGRLVYDPAGRLRASHSVGMGTGPILYRVSEDAKTWEQMDRLFPEACSPAWPPEPESFFGRRAIPLAFDYDPKVLYFASNVGRDTFGIYSLDLTSGRRGPVVFENSREDLGNIWPALGEANVVLDRYRQQTAGFRAVGMKPTTLWLDPALQEVQSQLEKRAPAHAVRIVEWAESREIFLVQMQHRSDPGAYYLFRPKEGKLHRVLSQNTAVAALGRVSTIGWSAPSSGSVSLSGQITLPEHPAAVPVPVILRFQAGPWQRATAYFSAEVRALAHMGFAVLEVNHRGCSGYGIAHWRGAKGDPDRVVLQDVIAALDAVAANYPLDTKRVALWGEDFGGYLALRCAQQDRRFACVVAIDPVLDLNDWLRPANFDSAYFRFEHATRRWFFGDDRKQLERQSPISNSGAPTAPVLLVGFDTERGRLADVKSFHRKISAAGQSSAVLSLSEGARVPGQERGALFRNIQAFLNQQLAVSPRAK